ncbi:sialate O-acetylesterase [Spirosoma luteolum]
MGRLGTLLVLLAVLMGGRALADVRLPHVFGDHMVLQRRKPVPVWGWASAGEKLTIAFNGQTKTARAAKDGRWRVQLDPMEAGGPYQLVVTGKTNTVQINDVLLGEVWLCSGQSNMEFSLQGAANGPADIRKANYPTIRQLLVTKAKALTPQSDINGSWAVCSPATAATFSAVGYYFARALQDRLQVPIGIINSSWGGTHAETWTSREALNRDTTLRYMVADMPATYDEAADRSKARLQALLQEQQGGLPSAGEARTFAAPEHNTSDWKTMLLPGNWQGRGLPGLNGVVWLRKDIILPEGTVFDGRILQLAAIEETDSTYVNGQLVGSGKGVRGREYALPAGLLHPGINTITIRVDDRGGPSGLLGEPDQLKLTGAGDDVPLAGQWRYRVAHVEESSYKAGPNTYPTQLFNAMIAPLVPYALQGVLWYQGESNANRAYEYRRAFPALIQDWRQHWGQAGMPFLFVQLAAFSANNGTSATGSTWAELREAQAMALQLPVTGMAVAADIGDPADIHPKNKLDVGKRLAAEAMRVAYDTSGQKNALSQGPLFDRMVVREDRVTLVFRQATGGLVVKDRYGYVRGFEVAGSDQKFYYARAEVLGELVVVHAPEVPNPVAVRYGWADDNSDINLYNRAGFPAAPFRTDTWKTITDKNRFSGQ